MYSKNFLFSAKPCISFGLPNITSQGAGLNTLHKVGKYYVKNSVNYNLHILSQNNIGELKPRFFYFYYMPEQIIK